MPDGAQPAGFGYRGNFLPAGLNSLTAGIGWFAVNSVSGGLALAALTGLNKYLCLVIVVAAMLLIAYFGHNLIQLSSGSPSRCWR